MIRARLEHIPQKSLRYFADGTGISKSTTTTATKLLELWRYKVTVVHALQPHDGCEGPSTERTPIQKKELKENRQREILDVPQEEFLRVNINLLKWHRVYAFAGTSFSAPVLKI
jgi:hypothetical protein